MKNSIGSLLFAVVCLSALPAQASERIHVMILDGESAASYHKWKAITPILKKELDETKLFDVEVVTAPPADGDFSTFRPDWKKYRAVVFNYDAPADRWPAELKKSFEDYINGGGGMVTIHAADNAFNGWDAFNEMIGVGGWRGRDETSGPHWYYKDGKLVSDTSAGKAGAHGVRIPFKVVLRDSRHPITKGLPPVWMHQGDELYAKLRGPGKNMTVLATAYSDPANYGTGFDEPQLIVVHYGKGRIFHSTFGHDGDALSSVDAVVTFQRGVEWVATGKVTQRVPASFPTADTVSYRTDLAAMDPNAEKGQNPMDFPPPAAPKKAPAQPQPSH